jgi:aryl-alcohol dehydrogenase-like predicted oxidoreductase
MEAHSVARQYNLIPPTMEQPQYNMFERYRFEIEYGRLYDTIGIGTTIWSPLASGMLTGKYNDGAPDDSRINLPGYEWLKKIFETDEGIARIEKVKELCMLADEMGTTMARLALAWCLKNPNVSTVIMGASKVSQLEDNLQSLAVVDQLSDDLMEKIEEILDNKPEPMEFQE